jgi:hypothetical protein
MEYKTDDTYEAAFYMVHGARITGVSQGKLPDHRRKQFLSSHNWMIFLENVEDMDIVNYHNNTAVVNVREFEYCRRKLKRIVSKTLS